MEIKEVNPDDLDLIFRGIQLFLEQRENDLEQTLAQLNEKYRFYMLQETDKRLFNRFFFRVSELSERFRTQAALQFVIGLKESICKGQLNFSVILTRLQRSQTMPAEETALQKRKPLPQWQVNCQLNRGLLVFYDSDFWRLYDIMLLNKQHYSSLIVYHQTKEENIERLYQLSLERNQHLLQRSLPQIDAQTLHQRALRLSAQTVSTMETRKWTMFSSVSPTKKSNGSVKHSTSTSPRRAQDPELRSMFDMESSHLFDRNFRVTRSKNLSLHTDKHITMEGQFIRRKQRVQQENFSPGITCRNQNWILPEIKLQNSIEIEKKENDSLIKPILIRQKNSQSPEKRQRPPIPNFQQTLYSSILPQYRTNQRAFQTIKNIMRK